jgi:transaldolase
MNRNPLLELGNFGQSVWLDFLSRGAIENGELKQLIDRDGVSGLTSNPSIFEKAIADSHDYDNAIRRMALADKNIEDIYQALTIEDIQAAADLFRPTYDRLQGADGYVSLEVSPSLAHDTAGTIAEARQLWKAVNRPNLMIKVPATREGLPAITELTADGINVNITLLFGLPRYREVAESYIAGLEALAEKGGSLGKIASVASFFLSRIDVLCDPVLEKFRLEGGPVAGMASDTHGQVAIASAKVAYQMYKEIFGSDRFKKLSLQGARTQRLLWASTGTKNPEYSDTKYVETLIGQDTINTMPPATLDAYRDHGKPALTLEESTPGAYQVLENLRRVGIDLDEITQKLEDEGVSKFMKAFDQLMDALSEKRSVFQTPVS